ncbi:glycosyltransferase family 39 protein [Streptomyces sp. NRRL B-24085]|uniref:glycosyltransferase family 39 protein n=1 Tax=Streptomyces sp. NRRL B-24085 TaxID=1709476 RepID=UPI0006B39D99|nr:glycosyltransferase family 39 protein [Streptomyces sp. NRRL B-24085]
MTTQQQDGSWSEPGPQQDWQQHYPSYAEQQQQQVYEQQQQQVHGDQQAYGYQQPYAGQPYIPQQPTAQQHYARPYAGGSDAEYYVPEYTVLDPEPEPDPEPGYVLPEVPVSAWSVDNSRSAWISRGVLLLILLVQAGLSFRLDGSAFPQEAKFLVSDGELSGLVAQLGLAGARAVSLAWALGATALLFGATRLLFNARAGLAAAAMYSVLESTAFTGRYASLHSLSLFLLASALWLLARTRQSSPAAVLLAAPFAALAPFAAYSAALYLPTLTVLAVLTAYRFRGAGAFVRGALFAGATGALCFAGVQFAGTPSGWNVQGADSAVELLKESAQWGGVVLLVAVIGAVGFVRRARMGEMPWAEGSAPGAVRRSLLGLTMCATALLAPLYQAWLGNGSSLYVHVGFGLLFAVPMAGLGVSRMMGAHFRYPQIGIMIYVAALVIGMAQTRELYRPPDSAAMVGALREVVDPKGRYLTDDPEISSYYLRAHTEPAQWYRAGRGAALSAEVRKGSYDAIVLRASSVPEALRGNADYRLLAVLRPSDKDGGQEPYRIWVKR